MQLIVENLSVARGEDIILAGVEFRLAAGRALVVSGENGAGKSTLLRALAGLLPPVAGTLQLTDAPAPFDRAPLREACHHLGAQNAMKPALTVAHNLDLWRDFCGHPAMGTDDALVAVDLDGLQDVPFGHLSTGQRRRIAIARLLVAHRPIWLLDEPTSGLDTRSQAQVAALMQGHLDGGGMIVAATHMPLGLAQTDTLHLGPALAQQAAP